MALTIAVIIASFGDQKWADLAERHAGVSVEDQGADEIILYHDATGTLATARNKGAASCCSEALIFCDADDQLDRGYVDAMRRMGEAHGISKTMFTPAVSYIHRGVTTRPKFWPEVPLWKNNWLVIGTMVPTDLFLKVGGFREYGWSEDWGLYCAMDKEGAEVVKVPEAIYRAYRSQQSRNSAPHPAEKHYWHQRIGHDFYPEFYDAPTAAEDAELRLHGRPLSLRRK